MSHRYWANPLPYSGTWTRTWEPGPVLGNLDLNRSLVWDLYSGTWTRSWETVLPESIILGTQALNSSTYTVKGTHALKSRNGLKAGLLL